MMARVNGQVADGLRAPGSLAAAANHLASQGPVPALDVAALLALATAADPPATPMPCFHSSAQRTNS